jgi:hypothetical protein
MARIGRPHRRGPLGRADLAGPGPPVPDNGHRRRSGHADRQRRLPRADHAAPWLVRKTARDRLDATQVSELRADTAPMDYSALCCRLAGPASPARQPAVACFSQRLRPRRRYRRRRAVAVLRNGLGHYNEAVEAARQATRAEHPGLTGWALMELVEAPPAAAGRRRPRARQLGSPNAPQPPALYWALGVQATAQALLIEGEHAEPRYREAVERLARTGIRCSACAGPVALRRMAPPPRNRRIDARTQLRAARGPFHRSRASAFADRAHRELLATGEAARKRTIDCRCQLTRRRTASHVWLATV